VRMRSQDAARTLVVRAAFKGLEMDGRKLEITQESARIFGADIPALPVDGADDAPAVHVEDADGIPALPVEDVDDIPTLPVEDAHDIPALPVEDADDAPAANVERTDAERTDAGGAVLIGRGHYWLMAAGSQKSVSHSEQGREDGTVAEQKLENAEASGS